MNKQIFGVKRVNRLGIMMGLGPFFKPNIQVYDLFNF